MSKKVLVFIPADSERREEITALIEQAGFGAVRYAISVGNLAWILLQQPTKYDAVLVDLKGTQRESILGRLDRAHGDIQPGMPVLAFTSPSDAESGICPVFQMASAGILTSMPSSASPKGLAAAVNLACEIFYTAPRKLVNVVQYGPLAVDSEAKRIMWDEVDIKLTDMQRKFALLLLEKPGQFITKEEAQSALYPDKPVPESNSLVAFLSQIRGAFTQLFQEHGLILQANTVFQTANGQGWMFDSTSLLQAVAALEAKVDAPGATR